MNPIRRYTLVVASLLAVGAAFAAEGPAAIRALTKLSMPDYERHIKVLASDEFEGRKPGSAGERKTVEYLVAQFKALGLAPANGQSYLQQVPIVEITAASDASLKLGALDLQYGRDMVTWTKRLVPEVKLEDSELVFVGHGVVAPEYGWNDYAGVDMHGKTAVILINDPGFATDDPKLFRGRAMTYYGRWTYKFEEAARQGAAGAIIIHDEVPAAYPWDTVQNSWMGPQLDMVAADGNAGRPAIEGWITLPIAEQLLKASGHGYRELLLAASKPGFRAIDLKQKASGALRNAIRRSSSPNVMAMLPGSKYPNEYVVYMAHWDHLGRTLARSGDNIFNGAVDNATGTSGLLTIAQGFVAAKEKPERSVVFLALTCEECGLLGSAYYVANPVLPLADTVAALNMDGYHFGGPTRDVTVVGNGASELEDYLRSAAKLQDRVLRDEPTPEKGFYFRSDHFNFAKGGVPALYIESGLDDREHGIEWAKARNAEYITKDYHKPSDEFRPGSDLRGGMENIELMFAVGMQIARERRFPNWRVDSEFRAARDRSRAAAAGSGASAR